MAIGLSSLTCWTLSPRRQPMIEPIKTTTWDFTCNTELTEDYCDVCAMDDTEDYGTVEIVKVLSEDTESDRLAV